MTNYVEYLDHTTYDPTYYHRDYEHDIEVSADDSYPIEVAKRAVLIAVPFLSLHSPFGTVISGSMGTARLVTHFSGSITAFNNGNQEELLSHVLQTALAVAALAGSVFQYRLGLVITTGSDTVINFVDVIDKLSKGEHAQAAYALCMTFNNVLYLATMVTGSLEIVLVSYLVQALLSVYQSKEEWMQGRYPEAVAKMAMGAIRLHQANNQYQLIQRRDFLFALKELELLKRRVEQGRDVDYLLDHPLADLVDQMDAQRVVLTDGQGHEYDFGSNYTGFGEGAVKGMNVTFKNKELNGEKITELSFKVNHVFRDRLQPVIDEVQGYSQTELVDLLTVMRSHASNMTLERVEASFGNEAIHGDAYRITLEGLGKIYIGASTEYPTQYDRVTVHLNEGATLYQFHELLSFFDLNAVLHQSMAEDVQRMQMGQLFRTFFPKEATVFERTDAFFDLSISDFRQEITERCPEMKDLFERYLSRMEFRENLPGRDRLAISGFSNELRDSGALGLTAAVMGAHTDEEVFNRVSSILQMGMMSLEQRALNGIQAKGLSWGFDLWAGSSDSVFTQIVSQGACDQGKNWSDLYYQSKVRFLFSNELLESGTYQYHYDEFGYRRVTKEGTYWWGDQTYLDRENIVDFTNVENQVFLPGNEVMIKDRIRPDYIKGIIVADEITKNALVEHLKELNIVQLDSSGHQTILGIDLQKFIHVGDQIRSDYFA